MWVGRETDHGYCSGEGAVITQKSERQKSTQGSAQGFVFRGHLAWKTRGPKFCEFLQPAGLKAWSFKGQQSWLGRNRRP